VRPDGKLIVVYATSAPDALLDAAGYEGVLGTHDRYVQQIRDDITVTDLGTTTVEVVLARKAGGRDPRRYGPGLRG
jgi:hypothetical protein